MQESYGEGVASHTGPESCAGAREGMGEALSRGTSRPGMEPRNTPLPGADAVHGGGRQHRGPRHRERPVDPARSKTPSMLGSSWRRNWEIPPLAPVKGAGVRAVNPQGARRR